MDLSDHDSDSSRGANVGDNEQDNFEDEELLPGANFTDVTTQSFPANEFTQPLSATGSSPVILISNALPSAESSSDESTPTTLYFPIIPDIALSIEQHCGKIDGYVTEKHCNDTSQCCLSIWRSVYALSDNADVVDRDPFSDFSRKPDLRSVPFLAFPYIDYNHEVQMLDRFSRLCHAEMYNDYGFSQRRCVQNISLVLSSRLLSLLQEFDLVTKCVEADSPFLASSLSSEPPCEVLPSLRSRSTSPVPFPSQNLGARRSVTFVDTHSDRSSPPAGRTSPVQQPVAHPVSPASFKLSTNAECKDDFPDRCAALLWGLKYDESDKLHPCRTARCSERALPNGRLCDRHSRIPKLELLGTVPLDSFERLDQHRSRMDALKIIFPPFLSPDPKLYVKTVMKRLSMIIDRCRAMLTCSQRFLKSYSKAFNQLEVNYHEKICQNFSVFGKFASALIFKLAAGSPESLSFISGEHGCAASFVADPCKTFFSEGFNDENYEFISVIFASICDFTVVSSRSLVDLIRQNAKPTSMTTQAIFQSLDKLAGFVKSMCLLWGNFKVKWPRLKFPFGLLSSSMFLSSLILYSPFSLPRVLASLDLLHSMVTLMNFCSSVSATSELSIEFGRFIASIENQKFTNATECESALSSFDCFLEVLSTNQQCQVVEGACPLSVAATLRGDIFTFLNKFQMQNESAAGICALLRNPKCWARREESCRILVTFLASSHESFNIDSIMSILPWENRYDEDWVEVESFALQSMVQAAEARPPHLQGDFLEISMKRILSCARITSEHRRSMCEVAIELLKVLACDKFPSAMFRNVLLQVDQELFSASTPPNGDGMKLFLQIVDIIVNKFPDLIQEVTERWMVTLTVSKSRFSVVSSAILLSSILRLRSAHVDQKLFSVDCVIPKISQLLSDSNDDTFFKLEDSIIHMLTLCRNICVVQRSVLSVDQIQLLQTILSATSSKAREALFSTILSPALFYLALVEGMLQRAPTEYFTPIQMSLNAGFTYLLTLELPDRTTYLRKFITEFCSNAVSALQSPPPESGSSAEFSNLFSLQLCTWPTAVSDSKVPNQIAAVYNACQAGLLCLASVIHPECPVLFVCAPSEREIFVFSGESPPYPNVHGFYGHPSTPLKLYFDPNRSAFLRQIHFHQEKTLQLIPRQTKCLDLRFPSSCFFSVRVENDNGDYVGPFHFRTLAEVQLLKTEINNALDHCESVQHFLETIAEMDPSKNSDATAKSCMFSNLISLAKTDPVILRFLSTMFASIFSSGSVQKPLVSDALLKYSQLLRGSDLEIESVFLVIRQALHSFPSVLSFGFSCLLSNPYVQEILGSYSCGVNAYNNPTSYKYFHASQIFKTISKSPNWLLEYHADISGETFFSCVDLVSETGMPKVITFRDAKTSCTQLNDFKKADKLKPTHPLFRQMIMPLTNTDFGQELRQCALRLVSNWSNSEVSSRSDVSDLAADILALLPASRSLSGSAEISLDAKLTEAIMHCDDIMGILHDIESCTEDDSIVASAVQLISIFERAAFKPKDSESWPLRKFSFSSKQLEHENALQKAQRVIPLFISKCVECIRRQTGLQSKFLLSGISTALRVELLLDSSDGPGISKEVLLGIHRIFANPHRPSDVQVPVLNSYPSSGYIRHDILCNFVDCVTNLLRSNPDTMYPDLLDLIGPLIQAQVFPKSDEHVGPSFGAPYDAAQLVAAESTASLWLTTEEMFTLCTRLGHLSDRYPLTFVAYHVPVAPSASVFAALLHLCSQAGIGCTNRTAAVTGLLTKIILQCASTSAGHASTQSSARLTVRAKEVLEHCRSSDALKHVIPLLVDTVMSAFCSISLEVDFRESTLGECFEILRVVLFIIQEERERSTSSFGVGKTFQEENVFKSFDQSLRLLTALFDSKTSRGSMISTKVCEHLLKVITSFDDLLSPRVFVEKLFLIHEIAELRRSQLALPVKNVVVTIQDSKKHAIERISDTQHCSSCNVEVKWAEMCIRCNKCHSCSSSEPQCIQLRQAHGWSGLTNIGNTCFMNAVLQQLAAIPWVVNSVLFAKPKPISEPSQTVEVSAAQTPPPQASPSLLVEFQKLVAEMLYSNSGVVGTREFAGASKFEGDSLILGQQQDAGSYFRSFIDQIEGDLNDIKRQEWRDLFIGSIQTQTIRKCHADQEGRFVISKSEDVFEEILLTVTGKKNLQECIAARLSAGERQVHCEHCAKTSTASTQEFFLKVPPILIFQFHRASADGSKCLDRPSFPYHSSLDLSSFMSPESTQQSCLYELQGVVLHKGESVRSGHYISIIRERATHPCSRLGGAVDKDPQWWMMNDETVSAVSRENLHELCSFEGSPCSDVHEALPYLLIFTRKHTRGPSAPRSFSSALTGMPAGLRDASLPFDTLDSETPGAETPSASAQSQVQDGTPLTRRKSEGTGAYVKGENFVARLDTVLQHSQGRVPLLSDGSQFVFQNILKRHDARVQSILLCHSYSNLIERMLKRLHEKPDCKPSHSRDFKLGDHVILDPTRSNLETSEEFEVIHTGSHSNSPIRCRPVSGGRERDFYSWEIQVVPKPAPVEDVRAVLRLGTSYLTRIISDHMTNPIAVNMSDRIWNEMHDIIQKFGWVSLVFVIEELEKFTSAGRGRIDVSKTVANRGFLETVCKMYRMLSGESVSQNQTPADKLRVLISRTPRYAKLAEEMTAIIQKKEGKGNAAALVTLMSDKKQLRIELEVAWFSCEFKDWSQTYNSGYNSWTSYGLGTKPNTLQQLLGMDINRKAAVRAALEETYADAAIQHALDPSNAKEGDDIDLDDAVLHDGAPHAESFGIEDDEPVDGDENKRKCWQYLNSMRDVLSDTAAVDAAAAVVEVAAQADVWACPVCTFENTDMTSQKCSVCESSRM